MISINDLTVSFGGYTLLDKINFHISENDKIGLVGKNGAGKSTIMKLICGIENPTSGRIDKPSDIEIGYLPQIMKHNKGRTVLEETLTAFDKLNRLQKELNCINTQLAERTDYESSDYMELIDKFNTVNDLIAYEQSEPPEVQVEKTLLGLGFTRGETRAFIWIWSLMMMVLMLLQGANRLHKIIIFVIMACLFFGLNAYLFLYKKLPCGLQVKKER